MEKYVLKNRNPKYLKQELASNEMIKYYNVDEDYNGHIITLIDYLEFENEYIQILLSILDKLNEKKLFFKNNSIENIDNDSNTTVNMLKTFENFRFKTYISIKDIVPISQLIFRGYLNGKIFGDKITIEFNENNSITITLDKSNDRLISNSLTTNVYYEKIN